MCEVKSMKHEWIWGVPVLIGIAVGVMLWDMNGFDVGSVIGAWVFIFIVMAIYLLIISNLPVSETNTEANTETNKETNTETSTDAQSNEMTPVQRHYVVITSSKLKK